MSRRLLTAEDFPHRGRVPGLVHEVSAPRQPSTSDGGGGGPLPQPPRLSGAEETETQEAGPPVARSGGRLGAAAGRWPLAAALTPHPLSYPDHVLSY